MMTVKDVMQYLQVSRSKVYRLIQQGALYPYKIGERGTRFKQSDLDAYIQKQNTKNK